jgi:hypothetical protein
MLLFATRAPRRSSVGYKELGKDMSKRRPTPVTEISRLGTVEAVRVTLGTCWPVAGGASVGEVRLWARNMQHKMATVQQLLHGQAPGEKVHDPFVLDALAAYRAARRRPGK